MMQFSTSESYYVSQIKNKLEQFEAVLEQKYWFPFRPIIVNDACHIQKIIFLDFTIFIITGSWKRIYIFMFWLCNESGQLENSIFWTTHRSHQHKYLPRNYLQKNISTEPLY